MSAKSCHDLQYGNASFHPSTRMPGLGGMAMGFIKTAEILLTNLLSKGCGITIDTVPPRMSSALFQDLPSS